MNQGSLTGTISVKRGMAKAHIGHFVEDIAQPHRLAERGW